MHVSHAVLTADGRNATGNFSVFQKLVVAFPSVAESNGIFRGVPSVEGRLSTMSWPTERKRLISAQRRGVPCHGCLHGMATDGNRFRATESVIVLSPNQDL